MLKRREQRRIRLSANLGVLYADLPIEERVVASAHDGFDAVEFHWPYEMPARDLGAAFSEAGLAGLGINTLPGNRETGEFGLFALFNRRGAAREAVDAAFEYAESAGIEAVHVMAGVAEGAQARAAFVDTWGYACAVAEKVGKKPFLSNRSTRATFQDIS